MRGKDKARGNEIGEWKKRGLRLGDRGKVGRRGDGQQQSLMLPWKLVYASLMHLVDPIRD